jgi:hypothetical protein
LISFPKTPRAPARHAAPGASLYSHAYIYVNQKYARYLLDSENTRALALGSPLLLVALVKRHSARVFAAKVVKVLDLVDSDDPVLAGESLLDGAE